MSTSIAWRIRRAAATLFKPQSNSVAPLESPENDPTIQQVVALANGSGLRINVGCGTDYREGWLNIDGSNTLPRVDKVLNVPTEPLDEALGRGVADYILANDVVEHVHHWEAVGMLGQFVRTLRPGGGVQIRVPDCEYIMTADAWTVEEKLTLLFGGQDVAQGRDAEMDRSRIAFPQFFCHKYGWSMRRMRDDLLKVGFSQCAFRREASNFIVYALTAK